MDAASLGAFRLLFGALVAWDAYRYIRDGWVEEYLVAPKLHFTYFLFPFVEPWPGRGMYIHFWVMFAAALFVSAGLLYRVAIFVLFVTYTHFFLIDQAYYMNHYYLIVLLCFLLLWMPANRALALDALWRPRPATVPFWCVLALRFQLFVMYFFGAVAKLNPDWLRGEPMYSALIHGHPDVPPVASLFPPGLLAYAIAYGGILFDLAVPILLAWPRTVWVGFALAFVFHLLNHLFLNIGIFSFLAVAAITIFFPPDWPRRVWHVGPRWREQLGRARGGHSSQPGWHSSAPLLIGLHLYALVQIAMPLRHFAYPGYVSWSEEGHRFAWHMKLREKRSKLTITIRDPASGRSWQADPAHDLRPRQLRKLETFPDILLQYVHYLRDRLRSQGISDPVITVDWLCSLNGHPHQRLVDPTVNLAKVERSLAPARWILPLDGAGDRR